MKCEACEQEDATTHLTKVDQGTKSRRERHLCEACAKGEVVDYLEAATASSAVERRLDHSYNLGISSGLEAAGHSVMKIAEETFRGGDDVVAKLLRGIANELSEQGKKAHPGRNA